MREGGAPARKTRGDHLRNVPRSSENQIQAVGNIPFSLPASGIIMSRLACKTGQVTCHPCPVPWIFPAPRLNCWMFGPSIHHIELLAESRPPPEVNSVAMFLHVVASSPDKSSTTNRNRIIQDNCKL